MATVEANTVISSGMTASAGVPELCAGDQLTRLEFERRYSAMPNVKKADSLKGKYICRRPFPGSTLVRRPK